MRIHSENTESFIYSIAESINKDPASMEFWQLLHIEHSGHDDESMAQCRDIILKKLKKTHTEVDCDVVKCTDNDILFFSRSLNPEDIHSIANEFINAASEVEGCVAEYAIYDLFHDWHYVRDLLRAKTGKIKIPTTPKKTHYFSEIESLAEVFSEAKRLRKDRLPIQVMIVEDDPVTRRIVTNAFKENYSLITAANAQEAIANYYLHAPDIVFLDIGLPDVSGFDVLCQIMTNDPDAYVVMFSGNSYLDNVTAALSNGASGFIAKPFKKEKLRHYIQDSAMHHQKYSA